MKRYCLSFVRVVSLAVLTTMSIASIARAADEQPAAPPNKPAAVEWDAEEGRLTLSYHGGKILEATVEGKDAGGEPLAVKLEKTTGDDQDKVEQTLTFSTADPTPGATLTLRGVVTGSGEAFPAETENEAQQRFRMVRNSVGLSRSLRNNAVYDRRWDWVLVGPADGATRIAPTSDGDQQRTFTLQSTGGQIELVFRPRFYQKHKELNYYTPWTYNVWEGSLSGYCTWWSYRAGFDQKTLDALLKVFVEKRLPEFGYDYMQFDNCYQIGNGSHPDNWLEWNGRYPRGWQHAMQTIRDAGMTPGIWVHRVHRANDRHIADLVKEHPEWFVPDNDGKPVRHNNCYNLNTHNKEAVETMIRPLYRGLKEQGWPYVKIDGAGDLMRAYTRPDVTDFFKKVGSTPEETWRVWDEVAREELGPDVFMLTCWGVGPGVSSIGLADGCRLGSDGFGTGLFHRYNSLNGVVWRNDPDHCDILGEYAMDLDAKMRVFGTEAPVPARSVVRPALCSVASGMLMLSDKVEVYEDDLNIEGMKRSAPVLFARPGQLYDVSGRKPGDYGFSLHGGEPDWWLLEIDRPFDHWSVLSRFQWGEKEQGQHVWQYQGLPEEAVAFADLGLDSEREYLVFEFWTQKYLGKHTGSFPAPAMDKDTGMQVFAIREAREHPWPISTTRHLSQGGVSLSDVQWDAGSATLSGTSEVVAEDPYVLTVHVPEGFKLQGAVAGQEKVQCAAEKEIATVRIVPSATGTIEWQVRFTK